jgi:hypothetical protein
LGLYKGLVNRDKRLGLKAMSMVVLKAFKILSKIMGLLTQLTWYLMFSFAPPKWQSMIGYAIHGDLVELALFRMFLSNNFLGQFKSPPFLNS